MNAINRFCRPLAVTLLLAFGATLNAAEISLKTQTALPSKHDLAVSFLDLFVKRLNDTGKGVVQVKYVGGPEVTPANKAAPALKRGVIDLLHTPAAYHVGIVPHGLTMMATTRFPAEYRANGGFALLEKHWEEKLNAKILAIGETGAQFYLYINKKPPLKDGVIDLTGIKMRTTGAYRPLLTALGATPVQIPAPEVFTGLQRGVVDGFGWPSVGLNALGLAKAVKYRIDPPFYHLANVVLINLDKWKSLPKQAQDILTEVAAWYEEASIKYIQDKGEEDAKAVQAQGVEIFNMDAAGSKRYLEIAYDAMWKRAGEKLTPQETTELRAKMYQP